MGVQDWPTTILVLGWLTSKDDLTHWAVAQYNGEMKINYIFNKNHQTWKSYSL